MKIPWLYLVVAIACFVLGVIVGRRGEATNLPSAVSVTMPDAGVATASVSSGGTSESTSITCRVEPPPQPVQKPRIVYVKGEPTSIVCPEQPACPVLVCEGSASTRTLPSLARADTPLLPPAVVAVTQHDALRKWGIGPALGLSEDLSVRIGLGAAWQPISELELHGNVVWTGQGKIPIALTTDVLFRF